MSFFVSFIDVFFTVLTLAIFARVILSWFSTSQGNPLFTLLFQITEPILAPIRRVVPRFGMFDLSPWIAIILLRLLSELIVRGLT